MKKLADKLLHGAFLWLYASPPFLFLAMYFLGGQALTAVLFFTAIVFTAIGISMLPSKWRLFIGILLGALLSGVGVLLFGIGIFEIAFIVLSIAFYFHSMRQGTRQAQDRYTAQELYVGLGLHAVTYLLQFALNFKEPLQYLSVISPLYLLATMLILNGFTTSSAMASKSGGVPKRITGANQVMVIICGLITLVIVNIDTIRQFVVWLFRWITFKIAEFMLWLTSLFMEETGPDTGSGNGGDMGFPFGGEPAEPSWWDIFFERLLHFLVAVILIAAVIFLLVKLYQLLKKLAMILKERFAQFAKGVSMDYSDEKVSLFDWGEVQKNAADAIMERLRRLTKREKRWEDMDNRQRVRYVVRSLYKRNKPKHPQLTYMSAQELLHNVDTGKVDNGWLADVYDAARYSTVDPSQDDANESRKALK